MRNLLFLFVLLPFMACKSPKVITQIKEVVITEKTSDTVVYTKPDSASIEALIKCDSAGNAYIAEIRKLKSGRYSRPLLKMKDNVLFAECKVDSTAVYLKMYDRFHSKSDSAHIVEWRNRPKGKLETFVDDALLLLFVLLAITVVIFMIKRAWK